MYWFEPTTLLHMDMKEEHLLKQKENLCVAYQALLVVTPERPDEDAQRENKKRIKEFEVRKL
jgi:hypothetical protein